MHVPIQSADIRSVYLMDRSGAASRKFKSRNPRIERIKRKVIDYLRAEGQRGEEVKV